MSCADLFFLRVAQIGSQRRQLKYHFSSLAADVLRSCINDGLTSICLLISVQSVSFTMTYFKDLLVFI